MQWYYGLKGERARPTRTDPPPPGHRDVAGPLEGVEGDVSGRGMVGDVDGDGRDVSSVPFWRRGGVYVETHLSGTSAERSGQRVANSSRIQVYARASSTPAPSTRTTGDDAGSSVAAADSGTTTPPRLRIASGPVRSDRSVQMALAASASTPRACRTGRCSRAPREVCAAIGREVGERLHFEKSTTR